jgi:hypothetical protein
MIRRSAQMALGICVAINPPRVFKSKESRSNRKKGQHLQNRIDHRFAFLYSAIK